MRRLAVDLLAALLLTLVGLASAASGQVGELRVEIHHPANHLLLPELESSLEVEGGASIFGGVKYLDLFLVLDTSKSLLKTDPKDYRVAGAVGLVKSLPRKSDIQVGVVDFDSNAELLAPLTADRGKIVRALRELDKTGSTDLAAGIRTALSGFDQGARRGSTRVILLFTDGKSDEKEALQAMGEARRRGVAIHTLLLGSDDKGTRILRSIAKGAGGSFVRVTDPARLPEAFLNLRTTGVERVTLSANGSPPKPARLSGGTFSGRVPLQMGENRIVATATSKDGETRDASVTVIVSGPLSVGIDTPSDGTVYQDRRVDAKVEGWATLFGEVPAGRRAADTDHGVRRVVLRVGDSPPFATTLENGRFEGRVMLREGENRILATATASDGRVADAAVTVTVRPQGCGELEVQALRDGRPALSISDRAVEIVFDASGSMWGQLQGTSKMQIAKDTLQGALEGLPDDLMVGLRVYGHQQPREQRDCRDSELLVPLGQDNRGSIRSAIASFRPRGQTPLAYSLERVAEDFGGFRGERAVVLVTDGIESCGGDPVAAARALQTGGSFPVHVIGFGLAGADGADLASLRAIADASGGRFLTAGNAEELRRALSVTVGTAYRVSRDGVRVAEGTLGADEVILLPEGDYVVRVESTPPHEAPVRLAAEENLTMLLQRDRGRVSQAERRRQAEYTSCADPTRVRTVKRRSDPPHQPAASRGYSW